MVSSARIVELAAAHRPGYCLAQPFYTDPEIFDLDLKRVFYRHWVLAGHVSRIPEVGQYFLYQIAGESIIVVRNKQGQIHALYNVCTHRGSRICTEPEGQAGALVCPYHAWVFDHDGQLRNARGMPEDFDPAEFGLRHCPVQLSHGMIFVYLGDDAPPSMDDVWRDVEPFLAPHGLTEAKLCHRIQWDIKANWKLVFENFGECYHCGPAHPEYCSVMSQALSGTTGNPKHIEAFSEETCQWEQRCREMGHFIGAVQPNQTTLHAACRMPISRGALSQSERGKQVAPLMGDFQSSDGGVTMTRIHPGAYVIASCDYAIVNRFTPLAVDHTLQEIIWLVHPNAVEGVDYNVDEITWLWRVTSDEDQKIIEDNHAGVTSRAYRPGRYATPEYAVDRFVLWYLGELTGTPMATINSQC